MVDQIAFEIGHFRAFQDICDLDLDLGFGHVAYRRVSLIDVYLHTKFCLNFLWTDGRAETGVITSTQRSRPKNNVIIHCCYPSVLERSQLFLQLLD